MNSIEFKNKLHSGELVVGTNILSPSPLWPKFIMNCGLDFVFIDTEHCSLDRNQTSWMCRTYSAMGLPSLVRIKSPDQYDATAALDDGANGIIYPYVEDCEQVMSLLGATKYRPLKGKYLIDVLNYNKKINEKLKKYIIEFNQNNILILNIESVPAIDNLDAILDINQIDAVQIGPHDLTSSMGIPEDYENKQYLKNIELIFNKARKKNIGAGIHSIYGNLKYQKKLIDLGANMIIYKADALIFSEELKNTLTKLKDFDIDYNDNTTII